MKKVVVYMPDDLLAEIDAEADRTGASRSAVMRDLTYAALRRRRVDRATEMQPCYATPVPTEAMPPSE